MRTAEKKRKTNETEIDVEINLDGSGKYQVSTDLKFFNHMLEQFAKHSNCDITINAKSFDADSHHLVEDVAIALGEAFLDALGDKRGIFRYGEKHVPMDEALVLSVVDFSGRAFSRVNIPLKDEKTSDFETVLLPHFFNSFAQSSKSTIHINYITGEDTHHIIEAVFKSFAQAVKQAVTIDKINKHNIPSTKGVL